MKTLIKKASVLLLVLSLSPIAFADDNTSPPPEDCYGIEVFGACLTHLK